MQQISISDIQRNLHKLDTFDIIEIVDKKKHKVKGYFIDSKYIAFVKELIERKNNETREQLGGSLQRYADPGLREHEGDAWDNHVKEKYAR
ncbi:hypothetical protein JYU00_01170 [bacterium AH-315-N22]|jgi:hypothetical protein|nr:hypothetical protein [bacterium AH-315-N22]